MVLRLYLCAVGVPNALLFDPSGLLLGFLGPSFFGLFLEAQRGPLLPVICLSCCFGQLRGRRGPPRFLIDLLTLIVLCGPASELSNAVKQNLVRAFLYIFVAPGNWLPAGGDVLFPLLLLPPLGHYLPSCYCYHLLWVVEGGPLVVSKNGPPPSIFLGPDFPDFPHFLYCVHRHTPHCPSSSEPKGSPRHPNGLPWGESARGSPLPRQMGVFSS